MLQIAVGCTCHCNCCAFLSRGSFLCRPITPIAKVPVVKEGAFLPPSTPALFVTLGCLPLRQLIAEHSGELRYLGQALIASRSGRVPILFSTAAMLALFSVRAPVSQELMRVCLSVCLSVCLFYLPGPVHSVPPCSCFFWRCFAPFLVGLCAIASPRSCLPRLPRLPHAAIQSAGRACPSCVSFFPKVPGTGRSRRQRSFPQHHALPHHSSPSFLPCLSAKPKHWPITASDVPTELGPIATAGESERGLVGRAHHRRTFQKRATDAATTQLLILAVGWLAPSRSEPQTACSFYLWAAWNCMTMMLLFFLATSFCRIGFTFLVCFIYFEVS